MNIVGVKHSVEMRQKSDREGKVDEEIEDEQVLEVNKVPTALSRATLILFHQYHGKILWPVVGNGKAAFEFVRPWSFPMNRARKVFDQKPFSSLPCVKILVVNGLFGVFVNAIETSFSYPV
ncbi:hypothetical protein Nepgr_026719 [Nepenthes gracilis]|uniref:Uncharacterized protein n=1 Tax=Nepenthes gracilis TaxID=150966 RepID=A0AAD3TA96_NEPGR|nr:hypothetical protein Nepgr_026719 [Nepenthes gracilis]